MAFDFLGYMIQQAEQQPTLFADANKLQHQQLLAHLLSLQLAKLIEIAERSPQQAYQMVQQLQHAYLSEKVLKQLLNDPQARQFFDPETVKIHSATQLTAELLLTELKQLEQNAHLGQVGLLELLKGQYAWMQPQLQAWFWDCIAQPEYKVQPQDATDHADLDLPPQDLNPPLQSSSDPQQSDLHRQPPPSLPILVHRGFKILAPILALLIVIYLFKTIF
jgi:hypothetical protein